MFNKGSQLVLRQWSRNLQFVVNACRRLLDVAHWEIVVVRKIWALVIHVPGKESFKGIVAFSGTPQRTKVKLKFMYVYISKCTMGYGLGSPQPNFMLPDWWHFLWHYFSFELATICLKLSKKTSQSALEDPINPPAKLMKQTIFIWLRCLQWREALFSIVCIGIIIAMMNTWDHLFLFVWAHGLGDDSDIITYAYTSKNWI